MKTIFQRACATATLLAGLAAAHGQTIQYDGIFTGADQYTYFEVVTWYNSHGSSSYGDFNSQYYNTFIRYGVGTVAGDPSGTQYFFLFAESPLEAKNMVWGAGMTALEISQYGKQLSFSDANGSEKITFTNAKGDKDLLMVDIGSQVNEKSGLPQTGKSLPGFGLISFKDSVDYLVGNGISTTTSSSASNYTMSVEMQFKLDPVQNAAVVAAARNGIDFHLSPDRGLIPPLVPEPSTSLLFGVLATLSLLRRKR